MYQDLSVWSDCPFKNALANLSIRLKRNLKRISSYFLETPFWGPGASFSNVPVTFRDGKQIFKSIRIRAWVLASKLLHFVSLTDSFITLDKKLLKPRPLM